MNNKDLPFFPRTVNSLLTGKLFDGEILLEPHSTYPLCISLQSLAESNVKKIQTLVS